MSVDVLRCPSSYTEEVSPYLSKKVSELLQKQQNSHFRFRVDKNCVTIPLLGKYVPSMYLSSGMFGSVYLVCENDDINKCKYVVKVMHPFMNMTEEDILQEMKVSTEMGRSFGYLNPVGPKVISTFCCKGEVNYNDNQWYSTMLYFIVMEKMDLTEKDYYNKYMAKCYSQINDKYGSSLGESNSASARSKLKEYKQRICNDILNDLKKEIGVKIQELLVNINKRGYKHNDIHENNVMFNIDDNFNILDLKIIDFGKLKSLNTNPPKTSQKIGRFIIKDIETENVNPVKEIESETPKKIGRFTIEDIKSETPEKRNNTTQKPVKIGRFLVEETDNSKKPIKIGRFLIEDTESDKPIISKKPKFPKKTLRRFKTPMKFNLRLSTIDESDRE